MVLDFQIGQQKPTDPHPSPTAGKKEVWVYTMEERDSWDPAFSLDELRWGSGSCPSSPYGGEGET